MAPKEVIGLLFCEITLKKKNYTAFYVFSDRKVLLSNMKKMKWQKNTLTIHCCISVEKQLRKRGTNAGLFLLIEFLGIQKKKKKKKRPNNLLFNGKQCMLD